MKPRRRHRRGEPHRSDAPGARPVPASLVALVLVLVVVGVPEPVAPAGGPAPTKVATIELDVAGARRTAVVVPPPPGSLAPRRRPPVLVVLHGVGGRGRDMRSLGLEGPAARHGALVVYPDAWRGSWNDGRPGVEPASLDDIVDDEAFLRSLIAHLGDQVAVVGFSNGALMAARLACDPPPGVVAVGLVGGTAGEGFTGSCRPHRGLPVVVVAGTADAIVPYEGGQVAGSGGRSRGRVASVPEFLSFWSAANGCGPMAETPVPGAALPVSRMEAAPCAPGGAVVHYRVDGGGHQWYRIEGFDTTAAVWGFVAPWLGAAAPPAGPWRAAGA